MSVPSYKVKKIKFHGRTAPIFLQNLNGPCPLLAIANILSLRNMLDMPREVPDISESRLVSLVAGHFLDSNRVHDDQSEYAANLAQNLEDGLKVLHKLTTGIDVNVRFDRVTGFEPTSEIMIFDLLDINLVHGWLYDPADAHTAAAIGTKSYNELVELLILALGDNESVRLSSRQHTVSSAVEPSHPEHLPSIDQAELAAALALSLQEDPDLTVAAVSDGDIVDQVVNSLVDDVVSQIQIEQNAHSPAPLPQQRTVSASSEFLTASEPLSSIPPSQQPTPPPQDERIQKAHVVREFLDASCNQLTVHGLSQLQYQLKEREMAVFFRNNHFNAMYKQGGALYLLVTDQGYLMEPDVVWERLDTVDGDTQLCDSNFLPFQPHAASVSDLDVDVGNLQIPDDPGTQMEDVDFALALHLQEQEEAAFREQEAARQAHHQQQQNTTSSPWFTPPPRPPQQLQEQPQQRPSQEGGQGGQWQSGQGGRRPQQQQQQQSAPDSAARPVSAAMKEKCVVM